MLRKYTGADLGQEAGFAQDNDAAFNFNFSSESGIAPSGPSDVTLSDGSLYPSIATTNQVAHIDLIGVSSSGLATSGSSDWASDAGGAIEAEAGKSTGKGGSGGGSGGTTTTTTSTGIGTTTPIQSFKQFFSAADLPKDTLFSSQWDLLNTGQNGATAGVDIDVAPVWKMGFTGAGVAIGVFDTAMDIKHVDLSANIDMSKAIVAPDGSYVDPTIIGANDQHATSVAGIIAADNNGVGAVGIAYDAKITPVDIITGSNSSYGWEALWSQSHFDVTNNSWGFNAAFVYGELDLSSQYWILQGFTTGADTGRGGLGTIENIAAGNYRQSGFSTETTGVTEDRHAVVVGATDDHGMVASY